MNIVVNFSIWMVIQLPRVINMHDNMSADLISAFKYLWMQLYICAFFLYTCLLENTMNSYMSSNYKYLYI